MSAGEDSAIKVWDYENGQFERTMKGHTDSVQDLAFNSDGTILGKPGFSLRQQCLFPRSLFALPSASCSADLSIKLWDFEQNTCVKTLQGHEHNVSGVQYVASGQLRSAVFVLEAYQCVLHRFLPSGTELVSCSRDKSIKVWDTTSGYVIASHSP